MMLLLGSDELLYDNSLLVTCIPAPACMHEESMIQMYILHPNKTRAEQSNLQK